MWHPHWSATNHQGNILIGRKQKNLTNNQIQYIHYTQEDTNSPLHPCSGCQFQEKPNTTSECIFTTTKQTTVKIPVEKSTISSRTTNNTTKTSLRRLRASPDSIRIALNNMTDQISQSKYQTTDIIMDESKEIYNQLETRFKGNIQDLYKLYHIA